jgi:hypothetical protein
VDEIAEQLPSADAMVKLLNRQKEIHEGHLEELLFSHLAKHMASYLERILWV